MWPIKRKSAEELDSILYFLSSALSSVIDESSYLAQHNAALPQIGAGLATAEIASRLAMFRHQVCDVSEREFMIVTKLARARHWAQELRRYEPHLRADIDAFMADTSCCETIRRARMTDPQSLFDGHAHPKRFMADRLPGGRVAVDAALSLMERLEAVEGDETPADDDAPSYLIGGEISVEALNEACEGLLARMAAHYGWENDAAETETGAVAINAPKPSEAAGASATQTASSEPDAETQGKTEPCATDVSENADPAQPSAQESVTPDAQAESTADTKAQAGAASG